MPAGSPAAGPPAVVLLGAAEWPLWPGLDNDAFARSHRAVRRYLDEVLGVPADHLLDLFGSPDQPGVLVTAVQTFLAGAPVAAAPYTMVYYLGHGERVSDGDQYALVTACADRNNKLSSSFATSFLREALQVDMKSRPVCLILDACYSAAAAQTFLEPFRGVGVTILASAGSGDVSITPEGSELTTFTGTLLTVLRRGDPYRERLLTLRQVLALMEAELDLRPGDERRRPQLQSPNQERGDFADEHLLPNPAFPAVDGPRLAPATRTWCGVVSQVDSRSAQPVFADLLTRFGDLYRGKIRSQTDWSLAEAPVIVDAAEVFADPGALRRAVRAVCEADLVFFDLTNLEPAVMVLLGIRAIIRRGVTICTTGDPEARTSAPPFLLRDINVMRHGPPAEEPEKTFGERAVAGIRELTRAPYRYSDLPGFDAVRQLSPIQHRQTVIPYYDRILFLCPFNPAYNKVTFPQVKRNLSTAVEKARTSDEQGRAGAQAAPDRPVIIERTLDMGSPRTVSANLLEAIRLTDLCICDITEWKPNVLFELGLRLAANVMDPVCIMAVGPEAESHYLDGQRAGLKRLLGVVDFNPATYEHYHRIVGRHRYVSDRILGRDGGDGHAAEVPPGSIHELAWRFADSRHEPSAAGVVDFLRLSAAELAPRRSLGSVPFIFPPSHRLTDRARDNATERLRAAWLYLDHRYTTGRDTSAATVDQMREIGDDLSTLLADSTDVQDREFKIGLDARIEELPPSGRSDAG